MGDQYGLYAPWHRVHQRLEFCRRDAAPFFHERESRSTRTCMMEVENAVSGIVPEYPVNPRLGSDLVTEEVMTYG